jgi:hypothetical protein
MINWNEIDLDGIHVNTYKEAVLISLAVKLEPVDHFLERQAAKRAHLGKKHQCNKCETKWYDLKKGLKCPKC